MTVDYTSNHAKLAWKYNDLYQAIHIMFLQNLTIAKKPVKLCALDGCNTWFIQNRKTKKFCSENCGNTSRQRTLNMKKKLQKEE